MTKPFQVMLAASLETKDPAKLAEQVEQLRFPLYASPKLDGFRAYVADNCVYSRNNKPIPNEHVQYLFGSMDLEGLDGELIVGPPNAPDVFQRTSSGVTSREGEPDVTFYVFDRIPALPLRHFTARLEDLRKQLQGWEFRAVERVPQRLFQSLPALLEYEAQVLRAGYEGVMLRSPEGPYKQGRATLKEQYLTKLKRFSDGEARILSAYEQETNSNPAEISETGHTKRSSAKAGKAGNGLLGGFVVKDLKSGVEFCVGTLEGVTENMRREWWGASPGGKQFIDRIIRYRYLAVGVKEKPRHPVFTGFREEIDL